MECSMCGDVGFESCLFQCKKCLYRFQHNYCTKAYYESIPSEESQLCCDWCLVAENVGCSGSLHRNSLVMGMKKASKYSSETDDKGKGKMDSMHGCVSTTSKAKVKRKRGHCASLSSGKPKRVDQNIDGLHQFKAGHDKCRGLNGRFKRKYKPLDQILC
eukprot:Gb_21982 [translate_table: standard]